MILVNFILDKKSPKLVIFNKTKIRKNIIFEKGEFIRSFLKIKNHQKSPKITKFSNPIGISAKKIT